MPEEILEIQDSARRVVRSIFLTSARGAHYKLKNNKHRLSTPVKAEADE